MKLYIKYMVSNRCKWAVKEILKQLELHFVFVELGEVEILENLSDNMSLELKKSLKELGLELMEDKRAVLIEKIKNAIIEMIYHPEEMTKVNISNYLSDKLNYDYNYLSTLFTQVQGISIEHFIILHKIERIKELLAYNEMNISEISLMMNYSSAAHLSNQFKNITGLSPLNFKKQMDKRRNPIEEIGK